MAEIDNSDHDIRLALDIGGTNIRAALVSSAGRILARRADATPAEEGAMAVLARLLTLCDELLDFAAGDGAAAGVEHPLVSVGVSFGGPVLPDRRTLLRSQHVPGWEDVALADELESRYGLPVIVENDANASAYGEFRFGVAARGTVRSMLYLTVSTGVGGAVILDGDIVRGENGLAGEIGHVIVVPDGRHCSCGKRGCVEAYASGTALAERAVEAGIAPARSTARDIYELAHGGSLLVAADAAAETARQLVDESIAYLGTAIAAAVSILDVHLIVIGGGVTRQGGRFFEPLQRHVRQQAMFGEDYPADVRPAQLGDDSGLLGAAALSCTDSR